MAYAWHQTCPMPGTSRGNPGAARAAIYTEIHGRHRFHLVSVAVALIPRGAAARVAEPGGRRGGTHAARRPPAARLRRRGPGASRLARRRGRGPLVPAPGG